jgi:hypothetical protein
MRIAPPRMAGGLRGLPKNTPSRVNPAIAAALTTDGSPPVSKTKKHTAVSPTVNLPHRPIPTAVTIASNGATNMTRFCPETAVRWDRPVARKSSSTPGSSRVVSPSRSPISRPASRSGNSLSREPRRAVRMTWAALIQGVDGGPRLRTRTAARVAG